MGNGDRPKKKRHQSALFSKTEVDFKERLRRLSCVMEVHKVMTLSCMKAECKDSDRVTGVSHHTLPFTLIISTKTNDHTEDNRHINI